MGLPSFNQPSDEQLLDAYSQAVVQAVVQVDLTVRTQEKKPMTRGRREMNDTGGF